MKEDDKDPLLNKEKNTGKRDSLLISEGVAWVVIILGYVGEYFETAFAGFNVMMCSIAFSMLSGDAFLEFYSTFSLIMPNVFIYLSWVFITINCTYACFSFYATRNIVARTLYIVSAAAGVVTLILSFTILSTDQVFTAMNRREEKWWRNVDTTIPIYKTWYSDVMVPFKALAIVRCVFVFIMALSFVFGFNFSSADFFETFQIE